MAVCPGIVVPMWFWSGSIHLAVRGSACKRFPSLPWVSPVKGMMGRVTTAAGAAGYVACRSQSLTSSCHFPWVSCTGRHQSQTQGCESSWQGKKRLQSVLAKSQQPLKYFWQRPPNALPALPPSCLCQGGEYQAVSKTGYVPLLENHLGVQTPRLFPSFLHFKRRMFPFAFPPTFLLKPGGAWRGFAAWWTAVFSSHQHHSLPPTKQPHPDGKMLNKFRARAFACPIN